MSGTEDKPKVAFYWCASCGGCEEAVVDLAEAILDVVAAVDIVFWPVALDFKRTDVEAMEDGAIFASFINGAVRTSEQEEMVHLMRRKSQAVVAFGSCAHMGGIPGLANLWDRKSVFQSSYHDAPSTVNPEGVEPQTEHRDNGHDLHLPRPGCAPTPAMIAEALQILLGEELPPKGTVVAPDQALCEECTRRESRPEELGLTEFKRPHEVLIDEDTCILAQGVLCMGPATRAGCEALCVQGNMPCTGCFGPTSRVRDHGAKALSSFASIVASNDEEEVAAILDGIPDPIGTIYRYGLPVSLLRRKKQKVR
ncbi:MAG: NADH-quinone oxidoreductase subunit B family protein [Planctomycetota bacterium]|jgi:F420-non-reducing hydrogenase small subunit